MTRHENSSATTTQASRSSRKSKIIKRILAGNLVILAGLMAWPMAVMYRHFNGDFGPIHDHKSFVLQIRAGWSFARWDPSLAYNRFMEIAGLTPDRSFTQDGYRVVIAGNLDWLKVLQAETERCILYAESRELLYSGTLYARLHHIKLKDGLLSWLDEDDNKYLYDLTEERYIINYGQRVSETEETP
jgi:hypothetical protein